MASAGYLAEIFAMAHCDDYAGVVMLWWAFDESYEHSPETGHATRVTIGGSVASCDTWIALEADWRSVLARFALPEFHMTDFEANRALFTGWEKTPDRRRDLLGSLLDVSYWM